MSLEAKKFLENKQEEHFKQFGVYADVNSKLAEWMQEYKDKQTIMTKQDLVKLLKKEFTNEDGNIDISGLDFGKFEGFINLSKIKSRGDVYQNEHSNKGDVYQDEHLNGGYVHQYDHSNKGDVYQGEHSNEGDVYQEGHSNKGRVID